MTCLVTGGAGFIGRHLTKALSRLGMGVRILDDFSRALPQEIVAPGVEVIRGDVRAVSDVKRVIQGCDVIFHLAAEATVMSCEQNPDRAQEVNAGGTFNILRLAGESGVQRVVFASSREVYGEANNLPVSESAPLKPKNAYGATKAAAEMYCNWARSSHEIAVLRLSNVIGVGDTKRVIPRFIEAAMSGEPLVLYGGEQVVDFVGIDVVVRAFVRAGLGAYTPEPVNIASGVGTQILEVARRVLRVCDSTSELKVLERRAAEVSKFVADTSRMRNTLGVVPDADPLQPLDSLCSPENQPSPPRETFVVAG